MTHAVYQINIHRKELPNKYIGSKSNVSLRNGKMFSTRNKEYIGSSRDKNYKLVIETYGYSVTILYECDTYQECLEMEKQEHIKNDVSASPEFFNKSIATTNNYSNPDYATYKHTVVDKTARLPRDHPKVLSGEWVGVSKGSRLTEEHKARIGRYGKENGFYGKKHTQEVKDYIGKINSERVKPQAEIDNWVAKVSSKPKSAEHRAKIGRPGLKMVIHTRTLQRKRIPESEIHPYFHINLSRHKSVMTKTVFEELDYRQRDTYLERADFLHERGYLREFERFQLAEMIYHKDKQNASSKR